MSAMRPAGRLRRMAKSNPLQGGLTGIVLVALATLGLAAVGALICLLAILLIA